MLITHPRDKEGDYGVRVVIHALLFPIVALMLIIHPVGGAIVLLAFTYTFNKYQRNEDAHTKDEAWKDQAGYMWAVVLGVILYIGVRLAPLF
jgi:small neutral amino acid transporter SnatA (MarC family)